MPNSIHLKLMHQTSQWAIRSSGSISKRIGNNLNSGVSSPSALPSIRSWARIGLTDSEAFTTKFSKALHTLCTEDTNIVFLSCPTAYVGFQYEKQSSKAKLLEYDPRFKLFAGDQFVQYDLHEPKEGIPEELYGKVDICVIDPPFLNRQTNEFVAELV